MNTPATHQIIKMNGQPVFAVVPYEEYLALVQGSGDEALIPHEVVRAHGLEGKSLVRAWREHLGLTQRQVAARLGVTQSAFAQMERAEANLRPATLKRLAKALGLSPAQIAD